MAKTNATGGSPPPKSTAKGQHKAGKAKPAKKKPDFITDLDCYLFGAGTHYDI